MKDEQHIISLLVNNKPGVLIRIALIFSKRAYNIDSLVTHPTHDPKFSIITISASGEKKSLELIIKQLYKLVDVIEAKDRSEDSIVTQELALIKLNFEQTYRKEVLQIASSLQCNILDIDTKSIIISCVGSSTDLDSLEEILENYGIIEIIRTGTVLMLRGAERTT